jgi:uncharacterized protein (DUF169 family)
LHSVLVGLRIRPTESEKYNERLLDMSAATGLADLLDLGSQPVAVKFQDSAPQGMARIDEVAPAGCAYWKLAADGRTFYTQDSDHYRCPIGAHTHGVDMPAETAKELEGLIGTMVELGYISMDEVPGIPRRTEPFGVAIYAPLADAAFEPDVVLVSGNAKQMMLLAEAAHAAGIACDTSLVGRPTCAAIPAVMQSGRTAANLGCIGNRVYTDLPDDELYFVIAGPQLDAVVDKLETIVNANRELEDFHRGRVAQLT